MSRTVVSVIAALLLSAGSLFGQQAPKELIVQFHPINVRDDLMHVDMLPNDTITLRSNYQVRWTSDDERIANVDARGFVTAKRVGVTTVTAHLGTAKIPLKVCVAPKALYYLSTDTKGPWKADKSYKNSRMQMFSVDTLRPNINWKGCEHWFLGAPEGQEVPDTAKMSITNTGLLLFNSDITKYYVGAAVGTKWPHWVPIFPNARNAN